MVAVASMAAVAALVGLQGCTLISLAVLPQDRPKDETGAEPVASADDHARPGPTAEPDPVSPSLAPDQLKGPAQGASVVDRTEPAIAISVASSAVTTRAPAPGALSPVVSGSRNASEPTASAARSARPSYAVQVGAFRVEASALALRDRVSKALADAGVTQGTVRVVAWDRLFRVLVGEAESLVAAKELAARIREALPQQESFVRSTQREPGSKTR